MQFEEAYERYSDDIRVAALSQRVPGLDYDDIVQEMLVCLSKAVDTWDPKKGGFAPYWWSLWLNRRSDLTDTANRLKRPRHVLAGTVRDTSYTTVMWPEPPQDADHNASMVWYLLASGERVKEVIEQVGLSRRAYYDLISSWRTAEVRRSLCP